jgi:hypothetical protein
MESPAIRHGEAPLADKPTRLILDALARAAAEGPCVPLLAAKGGPGLFPPTAPGKLAAQRALDDGLLAPEGKGHALTEKGRAFLADRGDVRVVLDDFVRVLEARQAQAAELVSAARQNQAALEALRTVVADLGTRLGPIPAPAPAPVPAPTPAATDPSADILAHLDRRCDGGTAHDYPLPDLFRRLSDTRPGLTVGHFHDALRRLHDSERLYLHPWTGPLYDLPEPTFALLVGHEVAYYASARKCSVFSGQFSEQSEPAAARS